MLSKTFSIVAVLVVACAFSGDRESLACTVFLAADGDTILAGNNEDWHVPLTKLWFLPAEEGKHGVIYVTFSDHRAIQGGMNDQGLVFDFLAVKPRDVKPTPDKLRWNAHPLRKVMEECATVDEAVAMLEGHNRGFMRRICVFLGDAQGNSAIVEAEAVVRKEGNYQLATNFRQSLLPPGKATCWRYRTANRMLSQADEFDVDLFQKTCEAVHQEGKNSTLYSTVYDLKRKVIYLYHFHDFDNVVEFDLAEELAKGERVVEMPSLFPAKPAFERFQRASTTDRPATDAALRD
jgi:penicillin V acylase-like amidase (Ntn superfamily)